MRKTILFLLFYSICLANHPAFTNNEKGEQSGEEKEKPVSFRVSGFIKTDYWYDTRSIIAAREDLFLLFPADINPDTNGADLNGDGSFNYSAVSSRIAGYIKGPDAFNAKTSGLIEADFSGVTNADINGLRLRHAYVKLEWEKIDLMLGQWWHPMFGLGAVPTVVSLNTGAPFQPFIRNPLVSLTFKHDHWQTLVAAIAQRDNASDGPDGVSPKYLRNSAIPNVHLQFIYNKNTTTAGLAADYKIIRPRMVTDSFYKTDETIGSYAFMGYIRHRPGLWDLKAKAIWGQNMSEHLMLGGYAESTTDPVTGFVSYTPLNHFFTWANIVYGEKIQAGLFAGYAHNFGTSEEVAGNYYGRGHNIAYVYRIAPSLSFTSGKVQFSTELEYTAAAYGTPGVMGKVTDHKETGNLRLLFTALYFF
ncbi:MAG: hypothetical protein ACOC12_03250 [Bacteroidota bacterium]